MKSEKRTIPFFTPHHLKSTRKKEEKKGGEKKQNEEMREAENL